MNTSVVVNSLGEVFRDHDCLIGSINSRLFAERYGFWWNRDKAVYEPVDDYKNAIDVEFLRQLRFVTEKDEYFFVKKVWQLQELQTGRFRVYGKYPDIFLSTEFIVFSDETFVLDGLKDIADETGAQWIVLYEDVHTDHVTYDLGTPNQHDVFGPDHGRPQKQIEFAWSVTNLDEADLLTRIHELSVATEDAWDNYGVAII